MLKNVNIVVFVYFFFVHTHFDSFSRFMQERSMPFKAQLSWFYIEKNGLSERVLLSLVN